MLPEELDDIFDKAPKFPAESTIERIDVDSFVQVYRDIDDLFDDVDDEATTLQPSVEPAVAANSESAPESSSPLLDSEPSLDDELESIYESICDDNGLIGKEQLRSWDEVARLMQDGLLGDDELDELWATTEKTDPEQQLLDLDGFLSFNVALDNLFDFDDDDMLEEDEEDVFEEEDSDLNNEPELNSPPSRKMIAGHDLSSEELFVALSNPDSGGVGFDDLKYWKELHDMLAEGDVLESELKDLYQQVSPSAENPWLDMEAFIQLTRSLDNLFEDDDDDDDAVAVAETAGALSAKNELLDALDSLQQDDVLPCGLEANELEQREIRNLVGPVEESPSNWLLQREIDASALSGIWELMYTSSSAMMFNKGLTGLGGSVPNGRFGRLQQKLTATKFLMDVEYVEHIVLTPASASFDVTVTGTWEVRSSVSLFTGAPSMVLQVVPDRVTYGPTSTRADHWKSLGPMNLLDISYLDENLRIMRGNTSVDTIFIFRRIK